MKQHTMVAMMATNRRMEEAMPAMVVGLREGRRYQGEGSEVQETVDLEPSLTEKQTHTKNPLLDVS